MKNFTNQRNIDINSGKNNINKESANEEGYNKPSNIDNNSSRMEINSFEKMENKEEEEEEIDNYDDLTMSQSVLLSSYNNIDLNSAQDMAKIKQSVIQQMEKGYIPIFLRFEDDKPVFYYIRKYSNLKSLLESHFKFKGITNSGKKYLFYNNGKVLDENIKIEELKLPLFSSIEIHK